MKEQPKKQSPWYPTDFEDPNNNATEGGHPTKNEKHQRDADIPILGTVISGIEQKMEVPKIVTTFEIENSANGLDHRVFL